MNNPIQTAPRLSRSTSVRYSLGLALLVAVSMGSSTSHADPGDFQAMPGLWKIIMRTINHGQPGQPTVRWHCVDEGADPWAAFADLSVPGEQCQRGDGHRRSTALAWTLSCAGHPPVKGSGRVDFDSAEHYTGSITLGDRGEVVHVEGKRYAACTSPSD
ncbi:MAG: DUF3617 family protein [Rhodanobacter sp.]